MDINLGDIFKSPYFNRIMAALAVATIIAAIKFSESKTLFVLAVAFSVYTLFTVIAWLVSHYNHKQYIQSIEESNRQYKAEKAAKAKAQAEYVFGRLSFENQQVLMAVIREGVINGYSNSRLFRDKRAALPLTSKLQSIVSSDHLLWDIIQIDETFDSITVIINPDLYDVITEKMNIINTQ